MAENTNIVSALNAGSGINIKELAQALVDAEKVPRESLVQSKIDKSSAKISGLGIVKNVLERFKTAFQKLDSASDFKKFTVSNSNTSAINLSATALANPGSHSIEVQSLAKASRQKSSGFSATNAEINGGEPFAIQITSREKQTLTFTAVSAAGTITVSGINVALGAGDSAATVASKVKEALEASGSSFISTYENRKIEAKSDGTLTVTYELSEGDVSASSLVVSSIGSSDLTATFATIRNGLQEINIGSANATPIGIVSELNSAGVTLGLRAQLINDGSGSTDPYKILLTGTTGEENEFTIATTSSQAEVQSLVFGTAQSTGSFTVAGVSVSVSAGESPSVIAARVKASLDTDGFITNSAGRSITDAGSGQLNINYTRSDGDIAFPTFASISGVVDVTISEATAFSANSSLAAFSFSSIQSASDAKLVVDGMSVSRGSNLIGDVVQGVTMELLAASSAAAAVNIGRDTSTLQETIKDLATAYNETVSDFNILTGPVNSEDPDDILSGSLYGETSIRTIKNSLRSMLVSNSTTPSSNFTALRDIGFSVDRNGILTVDDAKLGNAIENNFEEIVTLFGGNSVSTDANKGVAGDGIKKLDEMLSATGIIKRQTSSAETDKTRYETDLDKLKVRYEALLERYTRQFAIMDALVSQYNSTRNSLQGSFDAMLAMYTRK